MNINASNAHIIQNHVQQQSMVCHIESSHTGEDIYHPEKALSTVVYLYLRLVICCPLLPAPDNFCFVALVVLTHGTRGGTARHRSKRQRNLQAAGQQRCLLWIREMNSLHFTCVRAHMKQQESSLVTTCVIDIRASTMKG